MTCRRVPWVHPTCTCGALLQLGVDHGDDELGNPLCPTCSGCGCEPEERNLMNDSRAVPGEQPAPPNFRRDAEVLVDDVIANDDTHGHLANTTADELRDALRVACDRLRAAPSPDEDTSTCPRCGSDDPAMRILPDALNWRCTNPWHDDHSEEREHPAPSTEPVFVQLPSAPEVARWFIETERAGEFQNLGGSAVRLSDNPTCSVWHLATVDHDEQMHYLLDVHTDGSHDLLYVTWGLREEMGCEWRQQPSDVMPWGYDALVWFAERIEFANENCGIPLVWLDDLDDEPAGVPALDDDTRREVEVLIRRSWTPEQEARVIELLAAAYLGGTER